MKLTKKMKLKITHSFPPEIIREILLKAAVKSLLRCKAVCKEWYSLISDHDFIKTHYTISSTNNIKYQHHRLIYIYGQEKDLYNCPLYDVLFDKSAYNILRLKNPLQRNRGDLSIVGSCNGLVCLFDAAYDLFIYNPSTRIWKGLRRNPFDSGYRQPKWYSFGYDESTDDFKIVEISTAKEVNIYSLKSEKWKSIDAFSYSDGQLKGCGIFSNGALHWVAYDKLSTQKIVSLNLANETFGEVLQPVYDEAHAPDEYEDGGLHGPGGFPMGRGRGRGDRFGGSGRGNYNADRNFHARLMGGCYNGSWGRRTNLSLGVLGESLCGLYNYSDTHADLWVMNVYRVKDSWSKLASFSYMNHPWIDLNPFPLFLSNDGKLLIKSAQGVLIYKSKDDSIEFFDKHCKACVVVVESLVSPFPPLSLAENNEN